MLKMFIDNEEVVSNKDFTIKEEMLNASSTILNNTYPKSWEQDKDYTSRFYYPKDYAKLNIQNHTLVQQAEAGTTIQVNGSATLNDVDASKNSKVTKLLGQTSQNGTPTPSSPIPVNVVSGDNTINVCGKNLFDYSTNIINNANLSAGSNPKISSDNSCKVSYVPCQPNTTYTISRQEPMASRFYIGTTQNTPAVNEALLSITNDNTASSITITTPANAHYIVIRFIYNETADYETYSKTIQVENNNQATNYEPYVSTSYPIYLGVENLYGGFTYSRSTNGIDFTHNEDGTISVNGTASADAYSMTTSVGAEHLVSLQAGTYTLSGSITGTDLQVLQGNGTSIANTTGTTPITFTLNATTSVFVRLKVNNGTQIINKTIYAQLEKGSKANHFTPYGTTPIELCKIGTYQDKIYKGVGSNLFDNSVVSNQWLNVSGNVVSATGSTLQKIDCQSGDKFIFNATFSTATASDVIVMAFFDSNDTLLGRYTSGQTNNATITQTAPSDTAYMYVGHYTNTPLKAWLNKDTSLPYEPYNAKDKWLLHKEIAKIDLGSLTYTSEQQYSTGQFVSNASQWSKAPVYLGGLASSILIWQEGNVAYNTLQTGKMAMTNSQVLPLFRIRDASFSSYDADTIKTALNGIMLYYQMYVPTTTIITDDTLISQLDALESS